MAAFIKGEQKQFQSLHPRNTWNIWKDTQYSEVRNILCNIWMTLIFGIGGLQLSDEISLDSVQKACEAVPSHGALFYVMFLLLSPRGATPPLSARIFFALFPCRAVCRRETLRMHSV